MIKTVSYPLYGLLTALVLLAAVAGCKPAVEPDEPIRTSNPVGEMRSDLTKKLEAEDARFDWYDYSDALTKARKDNKYVMIVFYTDWCKWCKKLKNETLTDPAVASYIKDNFVAVQINAESASTVIHEMRKMTMLELAEEYGVTNFPTVWFLAPDGTRAKALNGYLPPEDFLTYLQYINTGSYKTQE